MAEDTEDGGKVVEFPAQQKTQPSMLTQEEVQEKAAQSQDYITQLVIKNRQRGLEQLAKKLENLSERDILPDPLMEHNIRELSMALQGTLTHLEALNSLIDMLAMDVGRVVQNAKAESDEKVHIAMHVQALIMILIKKELITHEDMETVFDEMRPEVEAMKERAIQAATQQEEEPQS